MNPPSNKDGGFFHVSMTSNAQIMV